MKTLILLLAALPALAQTGEVVWMGTVIGTSTPANAFDRDWTTYWSSATQFGDWAGMDSGVGNSVRMTRYRIAARPSDSTVDYGYYYLPGGVIECSNDATFATGRVTLDTLSTFPYVPNLQWLERTVSPGANYRACRVSGTQYGSVAELQMIVQAGPVAARPVAPSISPWGGMFPGKNATVTLTSATGGASIYYTTNGTNPTTSSTLYTGAFSLTVTGCPTGTVTVKAIAHHASLNTQDSDVSTATFTCGFVFQRQMTDDLGNNISAVDGTVFAENGTYYWIGAYLRNADWNNGSGLTTHPKIYPGVWMWKSRDLMNWTRVGQILDSSPQNWQVFQGSAIIKRPSDGRYVLWTNCLNNTDGIVTFTSKICTATSNSIESGWSWNNSVGFDPTAGQTYGYGKLYQEGSSAWVAYNDIAGAPTLHMKVASLTSDFLGINAITDIGITNREAPVLFKSGSAYFLLNTALTDYGSGPGQDVRYWTATSPTGTWTGSTALYSDTTDSPACSAITYWPTSSQPILLSTWYVSSNRYNDSYVWTPLIPSGTSLTTGKLPQTSWNPVDYFPGAFSSLYGGSAAVKGAAAIK